MRPEQNLQAGLKRKNAHLARVLGDPDRPAPWNGGVLLNQPLDNAGREQHGIDIVRQRRAVMAAAIDGADGIAHLKSVKRHEILMPVVTSCRFDFDQ
jgi:hypothetical protein